MADFYDEMIEGLLPEAAEDDVDIDDIQNLIKRGLEEAISHFEENIEPTMAEATDLYYGRPQGDERSGRSQVVSTDLRDATLDQIPDLLEIFMGSDSVVEFKPRFPEDVAVAEQATDMVNYIFFEDNPGFLILNSVFKDAGVRRLGYVKWSWDEGERVKGRTMSGLTEMELIALSQQGVDFDVVGSDEQMGQPVYTIEARYQETPEGRVRIEAVPPEEIVFTPEARSFDSAQLVAHVRDVAQDELIRMGISEDFILEHRGERKGRSTESLPWARQFYGAGSMSEIVGNGDYRSEIEDESQRPVLFAEVYALVDTDGDGVGELRMFQCVGPDFMVANGNGYGELVDEIPIAVFTPDPEPHTVAGLCNYDYLREVQRVKTQIQRATLNSLAQSIDNQLVVAQHEVNMRDLISPEISGLIRVRKDVNAVREIKHTFVGTDTLNVLQYYDQIRADRTGRAGPREGMDPNIMQSTTSEGVSSTLSKAQQRIRMLARVYAETGFKSMFKGIYRLLVANQRRERMVKLRGEYVQVNPAAWDADMDVSVTVALGTGSRTEKIQSLMALAEKQEAHLQAGSPLVNFSHIRNTYGKLTDLLGYKDTDTFWQPWTEQEQAQYEQAQAQAAQEAERDPQQRIVDAEELKIQLQAQEQREKLEIEKLKLELEDARERDKMAHEFALREYEIELQYQAKINDAELQQKVNTNKGE